ncbi:hypothetical protein M0813_20877 [Anaeramoeba flamelloides]|uniref:Uncharacterized protein n=1 Tax=Anaeramoeba flamelloides TaxID=1746091 RepID=A0ABQ8YJK7_9EUKA|nr:hypothetical protein M0813_20877 [Anaeramoeba flamelloides]
MHPGFYIFCCVILVVALPAILWTSIDGAYKKKWDTVEAEVITKDYYTTWFQAQDDDCTGLTTANYVSNMTLTYSYNGKDYIHYPNCNTGSVCKRSYGAEVLGLQCYVKHCYKSIRTDKSCRRQINHSKEDFIDKYEVGKKYDFYVRKNLPGLITNDIHVVNSLWTLFLWIPLGLIFCCCGFYSFAVTH